MGPLGPPGPKGEKVGFRFWVAAAFSYPGLAGASPWTTVAGQAWEVHGRLTPAHTLASREASVSLTLPGRQEPIRSTLNTGVLGVVSERKWTLSCLLGVSSRAGKMDSSHVMRPCCHLCECGQRSLAPN